jgi:putative endonuclease
MPDRVYCVYILTNPRRSVLYTGVTGALKQRVWQHREKLVDAFAARYGVSRLVYFETSAEPLSAITREKQIKAGPRRKKIELIERMNPEWRDLYDEI